MIQMIWSTDLKGGLEIYNEVNRGTTKMTNS